MLHDWRIEPREYARHESRRGRRHEFEVLDAKRTALVIVDMVPFFVEQNKYARGMVPNIERLGTVLRQNGGLVARVLPSSGPTPLARVEFLGLAVAETSRMSGGSGPLRDRLWQEFDVHDDDVVVEKSSSAAFFPGQCDLPITLERADIDTVLVTGTVANVCCESTAREASTLGYRVVMVADANAAMSDQDLNATLFAIYRSFGDVRSTDELVELLSASRRQRGDDAAAEPRR